VNDTKKMTIYYLMMFGIYCIGIPYLPNYKMAPSQQFSVFRKTAIGYRTCATLCAVARHPYLSHNAFKRVSYYMWVNMVYKANTKLQPAFLSYVSHFI
jgi:hypothetical protein